MRYRGADTVVHICSSIKLGILIFDLDVYQKVKENDGIS